MRVRIGDTILTNKGKPYFIADIGANHDGDLNRAFMLIELAKDAGADVAKFQNFTAKAIVSRHGFDAIPKKAHQSTWSKSVYEIYEDASISENWTEKLKEKCNQIGIEYMTSPYDMQSVDLVNPHVNAFKIGSGDITWLEIINYISKKNKPILLATGASEIDDVKRAYNCIKKNNSQIILMQCNTNYTAAIENFNYINLNVLLTYRALFPDCILGLSDHTPGHITVLGALALGARVFEKHFTDDNDRIGPDHKFAMNPKTWREMVNEVNILYNSLGDGVKRIEDNEKESAIIQRRSLYLKRDVLAGEKINYDDIIPLRPIHFGVPPYKIEDIIGKITKKDLKADTEIKMEDLNK
jgi:N-acetylneuraminate synthase